jgi:hypothetical protein
MATNPWGVTSSQPSFETQQTQQVRPGGQTAYQQPQTFSTMQKQGIARPPAPNMYPAPSAPGAPRPTVPQQPVAPRPGSWPTQQPAPNSGLPDIMQLLMQRMGQSPQQIQSPNLQAQAPNAQNNLPNIGQGLLNAYQNQQGVYGQQGIEKLIGESLAKPSAYDSDQALATFNRLNSQLSEGFGVERQRIAEEMTRRGVGDSTIHGGRLGDVAIQQARAQSDLAGQIATQQAQQYQQDRASALQQALGYGGFQDGRQQQALGNLLGFSGMQNDFQQQQFNNQMGVNQFNAGQNQQQFQNQFAQQQNAQGVQQQNLQNLLGYGQQSFQNQMATANMNNQYQQQQLDFLMSLLGMV